MGSLNVSCPAHDPPAEDRLHRALVLVDPCKGHLRGSVAETRQRTQDAPEKYTAHKVVLISVEEIKQAKSRSRISLCL